MPRGKSQFIFQNVALSAQSGKGMQREWGVSQLLDLQQVSEQIDSVLMWLCWSAVPPESPSPFSCWLLRLLTGRQLSAICSPLCSAMHSQLGAPIHSRQTSFPSLVRCHLVTSFISSTPQPTSWYLVYLSTMLPCKIHLTPIFPQN